MEKALNQLTTEYKEEQLANTARLHEKNLLTLKVETLVSKLETSSQEKLNLALDVEKMKQDVSSAKREVENIERGKNKSNKNIEILMSYIPKQRRRWQY